MCTLVTHCRVKKVTINDSLHISDAISRYYRTDIKRQYDFIECFTTTFLRAHSWLNWVDEDDDEHDEVGLKEKPEDTRYIKKITSK